MFNKNLVELHVHLDGAVRHDTLWELSKRKNLRVTNGDAQISCVEEFTDSCILKKPAKDLHEFLEKFNYIVPPLQGDLEAIERVAYEFCLDQAKSGVIYSEARYCPYLVSEEKSNANVNRVVEAVQRGLQRGDRDTGITTRTILVCLRDCTDWALGIANLCKEYKAEGVVAIDIAKEVEGFETDAQDVEIMAFKIAKENGIHRTAHAGESGGPNIVQQAVTLFDAERIGHGYHVIDDMDLYRKLTQKQADGSHNPLHFETCPVSSMLTNSVQDRHKHPILQFAEDDINFSISSDDPTITGTRVNDEYATAEKWGLTTKQLIQCNMNAARAAFLPIREKNELVEKLKTYYGDFLE